MSRDPGGSSAGRRGRARTAPGGPAAMPEPPDAMFWLDLLHAAARRAAARPRRLARACWWSIQAPPSTQCPKCDSPLSPSEPACPSCGLKRVMFNRFRASASDCVPAALEKLWREVEAHWSDPELHERFRAQVSLCGAFAFAASRYRSAARRRQSDAISKLQLERLSRMVHAVMAVSAVRAGARERGARPYRAVMVLLAIIVLVGGAAAMFMFSRRGATPASVVSVPPSIKVRRGRNLGMDGKPARAFGGLRAAGAAGATRADAGDEADDGQADEDGADQADQAAQGDLPADDEPQVQDER